MQISKTKEEIKWNDNDEKKKREKEKQYLKYNLFSFPRFTA